MSRNDLYLKDYVKAKQDRGVCGGVAWNWQLEVSVLFLASTVLCGLLARKEQPFCFSALSITEHSMTSCGSKSTIKIHKLAGAVYNMMISKRLNTTICFHGQFWIASLMVPSIEVNKCEMRIYCRIHCTRFALCCLFANPFR